MKKILLLLFSSLIIGACLKDPFTSWDRNVQYSLTGRLTDIFTNQPISGIEITVYTYDGVLLDVMQASTTTNDAGYFQLNFSDQRDFLLYWAEIGMEEPPNEKYQLGVLVNGKAHCRSRFSIDNTGNYNIQWLPFPAYRLQVASIPPGADAGVLAVKIATQNPNCTDTLLVQNMVAHLNNPSEMNDLAALRRIDRGKNLTVQYTLTDNKGAKWPKEITTECAYGDTTMVDLRLD